MDVRVAGHQVDTGDSLRALVDARLQGIAEKYFSRAISAQVTFGKGPRDHGFRCDIVAYVIQGVVLKSQGSGPEAQLAFEGAALKIEKQLRRYSRRLKDRSNGNGQPFDAAAEATAGYTVFEAGDEEAEPVESPPIVAETRVDIPDASVADAVMMLDLRNTNALMFRNAGTGAFNMVYRRDDGTIGWVEPQRAA